MKVPTYDGPQVSPTVAPAARLRVDYSPDDFGAAIGRGLMDVAGAVDQVAQRARAKANDLRLRQEALDANAQQQAIEERELANTGSKAIGAGQRALDDFNKYAEKRRKEISDPDLSDQFNLLADARRQELSLGALFEATGLDDAPTGEALVTSELEIKYAGYFAREREAAERLRRMGDFALHVDLPYAEMKSLSTEARQKLDHRRPSSLAMAARIPGVSPADLQNLVLEAERWRRRISTGSSQDVA